MRLPCHYEAGDGFPLVLLHGIGSSGSSWVKQLQDLSSECRVIAWDAPGYMQSEPIPHALPDSSDYAARLNDLLQNLDVERCVLLGHSLGALVAASYAKSQPDRVAGVILADPAQGYGAVDESIGDDKHSSRMSKFRELGAKEFARSRGRKLLSSHASEEQIEAVVSVMSQLNEQGYEQAANMLRCGDLLADAQEVEGPILVICGSEDAITPPDGARGYASHAGLCSGCPATHR